MSLDPGTSPNTSSNASSNAISNASSKASSDTSHDESEDSFVKQYWAEKEADGKVRLEQFKIMRELNRENEEEWHEFLDKFTLLTEPRGSWRRRLPDLRDFFQPAQVEWLIMESLKARVKNSCKYTERSASLIHVIKESGYEIEPDLDGDGNPVSRRATPLHYAITHNCSFNCQDLFDVYGCDVNYADENGLRHLHAAISIRFINYLDEFLERGHATCVPEESDTVDPPLHYALNEKAMYAAEQLIAKGADPNLANKDGLTPLQIVCKSGREFNTKYFDNNDIGPVLIDARDKLGRTPLQWAVSSLTPETVGVLLDRGADLSDFVFPDETYFAQDLQRIKKLEGFEVGLAAGALDTVERLEMRRYKLDRDAAQTIMKVFAKLGMFKKPPNPQKYSLTDPYFVGRSKKLMLREEYRRVCGRHLREMVSRQFFRRWALEHFSTLTRSQLSIYDNEKIIDMLENVDLWCICMAATGQISDNEEMKKYLEDTETTEPYDHDHEECKRSLSRKPSVCATRCDWLPRQLHRTAFCCCPLHLALTEDNEEAVESLLRRGADSSLANARGTTPLHIVCSRENFDDDFVELFFEIGEEKHRPLRVDARDEKGCTPLHLAMDSGSKKAVELLPRNGSDPNQANKDGSTALHVFCRKKMRRRYKDFEDDFAMHAAAELGFIPQRRTRDRIAAGKRRDPNIADAKNIQ
ncbi:unnamed protein product [Trichogramma brassicae]|uniref:Uncharacterized protein n=1 Tax=Trichogramma brassicae TaxID=86971 RepID=A0A6H5J670_9HYME|nr:unnamed protein product [Trichogramma brassicae]